MNISINVKELETLLDATPATHNIMLTGRHGIGKSEILSHYFGRQGIPVVALFLGQMSDPGDLIGLPNKDEKTGKTVFLPPYWFPMDGKPVVLFLDELNRARPEVLQTIMDLALNRRLAAQTAPLIRLRDLTEAMGNMPMEVRRSGRNQEWKSSSGRT